MFDNSNQQKFDLIDLHVENDENIKKAKKNNLSSKDWYWSTISRAQANDLLYGKKDGMFLVRDSTSNKNDYTLTVKKDGINKMIRIFCINGKYGFNEFNQFDSLESLIEYYTEHSLAEHIPTMNLRLEHSLSKANICSDLNVNWDQIDGDLLSEKLKVAHQNYLESIGEYDNYYHEYKSCQDDIQKYKQHLNCFEETFAIFDEQLKLNEEYQNGASDIEQSEMKKHHDEIQNKLEEIVEFKGRLEKMKEIKNQESSILDRKLNELKPLLNEKKRIQEQIKAILINKIGNEGIEKIIEQSCNTYFDMYVGDDSFQFDPSNQNNSANNDQLMKLIYCQIDKEFLSNPCSPTQSTTPKLNKKQIEPTMNFHDTDKQNEASTYLTLNQLKFEHSDVEPTPSITAEWYVGNMSKEQINVAMKNQPEGTFLVRDSKNIVEAPYTLTVRVNGLTKMLRILQSANGLHYGFTPTQLEFESVEMLINHYLDEPIIISNSGLSIRLANPMNRNQVLSQCK